VLRQSLRDNPVLLTASGCALVAGAAISAANVFALSVLMLILLVIVGLISTIDGDRLKLPTKPIVYVGITTAAVFLTVFFVNSITGGFFDRLGIYAPLAAVSSLALCRTKDDSPFFEKAEAVTDAAALTAVFAFVALPVAIVRELLGFGRIFGITVTYQTHSVWLYPFIGFILVGFCLAGTRRLIEFIPEPKEGGEEK
jgi:Na+-translocating ferredoxin:NAD+ oxidoreductase RnfE subunit